MELRKNREWFLIKPICIPSFLFINPDQNPLINIFILNKISFFCLLNNNDVVLEIGGNMGRNALIISKIIIEKNLVTIRKRN